MLAALLKKCEPPESVTKTVANFQTVRYVKEMQLSLHLNIDDQIIPLYQTVSEDFFLESCDQYILFLRDLNSYNLQSFLKMSDNLCETLELNGANFKVPRCSGIPHTCIASFVDMILNCGSISKIADLIRGSLPGIDNIEQDIVDSKPVLGEAIPECRHHTLDQNIFNYFRPQEFVEKETDEIIYAQVLYCNNTEAYSSEENMEKMFELKYTITIGNGTKLEVTVLQLYKFVSAAKDSIAQDSGSGELKLHEAGNYESEKQARQARVVGGKQAIWDAVN